MSTPWIRQAGRREWTEYSLHFTDLQHPSSGYTFDCDAQGNLLLDPEYPNRPVNLAWARAQVGKTLSAPQLVVRPRSYYDPGSVRCDCGREHNLARGDSCCACGQHFNAVGQQLVPPHLWEEEDY